MVRQSMRISRTGLLDLVDGDFEVSGDLGRGEPFAPAATQRDQVFQSSAGIG